MIQLELPIIADMDRSVLVATYCICYLSGHMVGHSARGYRGRTVTAAEYRELRARGAILVNRELEENAR